MTFEQVKSHYRPLSIVLITVAIAAACGASLRWHTSSADAAIRHVGPGQSIQRAINHAKPGDTIVVAPGTYHENLTIRTDHLTIRGAGASGNGTVLRPARKATPSACTEDQGRLVNGICITGEFVPNSTQIGRPIVGTTVSGIAVHGFSRYGFLINNAVGTKIRDNLAAGNGAYGMMGLYEHRLIYRDNVARNNRAGGFELADSPDANATIVGNRSIGNHGAGGMGVFIRDASEGVLRDNRVTGNCAGIMLVETSHPGASGWAVRSNRVSRNDGACRPAEEGGPPLSGLGIALLGASQTVVAGNLIDDNAPTQKAQLAGGLVVASSKSLGGYDPKQNLVRRNRLTGNGPADVLYDGTGSGNRFEENHCGSAMPAGLCG